MLKCPTRKVDLIISPGVLSVLLYYFEAMLLDDNFRIIFSLWSICYCAVILSRSSMNIFLFEAYFICCGTILFFDPLVLA